MKKILVSLVSGQTIPNLIGIRSHNPDLCLYLCTKESETRKRWLSDTVGIKQETYIIDAFDFEGVRLLCENLINEHAEQDILLNYTCGTKLMSIAAYTAFTNAKKKLFYIDSQNWRIIEHYPEYREKNLDLKITIQDYLSVHGQVLQSAGEVDDNLMDLSNFIAGNYRTLSATLIRIAKENSKRIAQGPIYQKDNVLVSSEAPFQNISINGKQFRLKANFNDIIKCLSGGWLEYFTFTKMRNSGAFGELALNVRIDWKDKKIRDRDKFKNELDIVAILRGNIFIIECKSGSITQEGVYKLKALKEIIGGTYANINFISYYSPSPEIKEKLADIDSDLIMLDEIELYFRKRLLKKIKNPNL